MLEIIKKRKQRREECQAADLSGSRIGEIGCLRGHAGMSFTGRHRVRLISLLFQMSQFTEYLKASIYFFAREMLQAFGTESLYGE